MHGKYVKQIIFAVAVFGLLVAPFGIDVYNESSNLFIDQIAQAQEQELPNPLNVDTPEEFIGNVIAGLLGISGVLALLMFVWGGILWLTAAGNPERIERGKKTLIWAIAGLVLIFSAYALVEVVIETLTGSGLVNEGS
jgi:hypothetical protein